MKTSEKERRVNGLVMIKMLMWIITSRELIITLDVVITVEITVNDMILLNVL